MNRKKGRGRIKRGDIPAVDALLAAQDADQEMAGPVTCEDCGRPFVRGHGEWQRTLCDMCAEAVLRRLEREALASVGRVIHSCESGAMRRDCKEVKLRESKPERAYALYLRGLVDAGKVGAWTAQPDPITLGPGCTYQPDYEVWPVMSAPYFVEVKGGFRKRSKVTGKRGKARPYFRDDGARVKVKWAAQVLARDGGGRLLVAFQDPQTKEWIHEEVPA